MAEKMSRFVGRLFRRKFVDFSRVTETQLARCLSMFDLTALGVGSTLGAGIYVVAGQVARETAGPSVILSFLVAAMASVLAGLCYAEFGSRVPKTGSAYVYSYVAVGELWAFIIGWNLVLEYVIGTASVSRAWSGYFDSLINNTIQNFFRTHMPMNLPGLAAYPDLFAFAITLALSFVLAIGVKESSRFNNIFTGVNLLVVLYVIICGLFKLDTANWNIPADQVPPATNERYGNGHGGFFPFGFSGMMSGAATCFYAFIGFDVIATTGEEVRNPQKAIPFGIVTSLLCCFIAYFGLSAVLTMMTPYFLLDTTAPLPEVFERVGWGIAKYIIAIGAVCGLSTSLLGAMFPLPRVIYAMATDGLIFRFLATINERFRTPLIATIISGLFSGIMAAVFDLKELVDMMSIGTLLAYTLVAVCVLVLRYRPDPPTARPDPEESSSDEALNANGVSVDNVNELKVNDVPEISTVSNLNELTSHDLIYAKKKAKRLYSFNEYLRQFFWPTANIATELSSTVVSFGVVIGALLIGALSMILIMFQDSITSGAVCPIIFAVLFLVLVLTTVICIWRQPQNAKDIKFKVQHLNWCNFSVKENHLGVHPIQVPLLPMLPMISMFINIYLMFKLSTGTWFRFGVWMTLGFAIYFGYGIWHSTEEVEDRKTRKAHRLRFERNQATRERCAPVAVDGTTKLEDV